MLQLLIRCVAGALATWIGCLYAVALFVKGKALRFVKQVICLTKPVWSRTLPWSLRKRLITILQPHTIAPSALLGKQVDPNQVPAFMKNPDLGEHRYMETSDGCRLHYVIKGPADQKSRLLICLHGFPVNIAESWYEWVPFLQHFSGYYTVVAPDLRGYGESGKPLHSWFDTSAFSVKRLAKDVDELVKELGFVKTSIVAHDWGGCIAWEFAHDYGQSLEKLVVMAGPDRKLFLRNISVKQFFMSWYMFFFQVPYFSELYLGKNDASWLVWLAFLNKENGPRKRLVQHRLSLQDLEAYTWSLIQPGAISSAISYYREMLRSPFLGCKSQTVPGDVLVFVPENDQALDPSVYQGLDKICKNLQVRFLHDCSHWVLYDALDKIIPECCKFLDVPEANRHSNVDFYKQSAYRSAHALTPVDDRVHEYVSNWWSNNFSHQR